MFKQQNGVVTIDADFPSICEATTLSPAEAAKTLSLPPSLKKKDGVIEDPSAIWAHVQGWVNTYALDPTGAGFAEGARPGILKILNGDGTSPGVLKSIALMQQAPGISRLVSLANVPIEDIVKKLATLDYADLVALTPRLAILASATELSDDAASAIDGLEQALQVVIDPAGIAPITVDPATLQDALTDNQGVTPPDGAVPADELATDEEPATNDATATDDAGAADTAGDAQVVNNLPALPTTPAKEVQVNVAHVAELMQISTDLLGSFKASYTALGEALDHIVKQQAVLTRMLGADTQVPEIVDAVEV